MEGYPSTGYAFHSHGIKAATIACVKCGEFGALVRFRDG
jgi:hypothetical protein